MKKWGLKTTLVALGLAALLSGTVAGQEQPPAPPDYPSHPPARIEPAPLPNLADLKGGKPWSMPLNQGWNLVAFPGQVEGPISGLNYKLVDASTNQPAPSPPTPWRAYWAYADSQNILSAPVSAIPAPPSISLQSGWNALASPLSGPAGIAAISGNGEALVYPQCYTGQLGHFAAQPFAAGFNLQPGQVVWVYAYQPAQIALKNESALSSVATPGAIRGQVFDDKGRAVAHARVTISVGPTSVLTDSLGRFALAAPGISGEIRMQVDGPFADSWRRRVTLPLIRPMSITLVRRTATLDVGAFPYKWGEKEYRPYSVVIYEYGNYHHRFTNWFPRSWGGRTDTYIRYFPQGMPYRMVVTWVDRHGYQQTLVRDGKITAPYFTFNLWNSWTYN